jgi:hypothetical protein
VAAELDPLEVVHDKIGPALEVLRAIDDPISEYVVRFRACHVAAAGGDLDAAEAHAGRMGTLASRLRSAEHQLLWCLVAIELAWFRGDWTALRAASDQALDIRNDPPVWRQHVGWRARLDFELGGAEAGERYLASYLAELDRVGIGPNVDSTVAVDALAWIARLTGNRSLADRARAAAFGWGRRGADQEEELDFGAWWTGPLVVNAVSLALAFLGAIRGAELLRRWRAGQKGRWFVGLPPSRPEAMGHLDLTVGDAAEAVGHFRDALGFYRRAKM